MTSRFIQITPRFMRWLICCLIFLWVWPVSAQAEIFDENAIFSNIGLELHLNPSHAAASDDNPGTVALPLRTGSRAIQMANEANRQGIGVRVLFYPGVYREALVLEDTGLQTNAPIILESFVPHQAIISGADLWTDWVRVADQPYYQHPWPFDWGLAPIPEGWIQAGLNVDVPPQVRSREMIVVNGSPLRQVFFHADLQEGTFYADEVNDTVYIWPLADLENARVEVAVRDKNLAIYNRENIAVRGLRLQHGNALYDGSFYVIDVTNLLVENTLVMWNNDGGFGLLRATNVILRDNQYRNNGGTGFGGSRIVNMLSENEEAIGNNWRGAQGGYITWSVAGIKHLRLRDVTYRNLRAVNNQTFGLWLDYDNQNVVIENASIIGNLNAGIFLEISTGPILLRDSKIAYNNRAGLRGANVANVRLENNRFFGNAYAQIFITGENRGRSVGDWQTGENWVLSPAENWEMVDNIIISDTDDVPLLRASLSLEPWQIFVDTLMADGNIWYNSRNEAAFMIDNQPMNLTQWQAATGQDKDQQVNAP